MCNFKKEEKINCKIATIITDYAPHSQWLMYPAYVDYFFVAHDGMKEDLINRGIKETQIKVTGIPLSNRFLAHYDKESILSEFELSPDKKLYYSLQVVNKVLEKTKFLICLNL